MGVDPDGINLSLAQQKCKKIAWTRTVKYSLTKAFSVSPASSPLFWAIFCYCEEANYQKLGNLNNLKNVPGPFIGPPPLTDPVWMLVHGRSGWWGINLNTSLSVDNPQEVANQVAWCRPLTDQGRWECLWVNDSTGRSDTLNFVN